MLYLTTLSFTLDSSAITTPAQHCPTWPCGCFCPEWRFHDHEWKPRESSALWANRFLFSGNCGCLSHKNTMLKNQIVLQMYLITLCFLFHRELLVFAKSHTHIKTSAHTLNHTFVFKHQSVILFSRHHAYRMIGGNRALFGLFPHKNSLSPFISWYNLIDRMHQD